MDTPASVRFRFSRQSSYLRLEKLAAEEDDSPTTPDNYYYSPTANDDSDDNLVLSREVPQLEVVEFLDGSSDGAAEERDGGEAKTAAEAEVVDEIEIPASVKLMYAAHEGDVEGIKELVEECKADVNYRDIDSRTPLHVAACQGYGSVVELLIKMNADVDPRDRWGSTPLADAIYYKNHEVVQLLEDHGAKPPMAPMHVNNARDVPEYEIDPQEIDFTNSVNIKKGIFLRASWRGIEVAVKKLGDEVFTNEEKLTAFRDELALLQRIRHPNVVQFLGAVTQTTPMMIVTEFLPKGDLCEYLQNRDGLKPRTALRYALDLARGLSYLHEIKPLPVIHCDLEPSNILRDDSGHLKVADFGVSKLMKVSQGVDEDHLVSYDDSSCRYVAPELFRNEDYNTKVDVFSFALILHEMIEGCPPFSSKEAKEAQEAYGDDERPPFRASSKLYSHGLRELIEECWHGDPMTRPTFGEIIPRLDHMYNSLGRKKRWIKVKPLKCFQRTESLGSHSSSSYAKR